MGWINILGLVVTLSISFLPSFTVEDRIVPGTYLCSNQTIISEGGTFALGFFSPNKSTNSYLGIWYYGISQKTVVWVANGDFPLAKNSSPTFLIGDDGNFIIRDDSGRVFWLSTVSVPSSSTKNISGLLADTGNLLLKLGDQTLWQSFHHPSDTFLPGMTLSSNHRTHIEISLKSWLSERDPQTGMFSFGTDPRGPVQILIWKQSLPYWRSDWDGTSFEVIDRSHGNYNAYLTLSFNQDEVNFAFSISDELIHLRYRLHPSGKLQLLEWRNSDWVVLAEGPKSDREYYGRCGPYSSCVWNSSPLLCKCLTGFEPKNQKEWDNGNWTEGCEHRKALTCGRDGFLRLQRMKLPDNSFLLSNLSSTACELECLKNCTCTAYAFANASILTRCLHWYGELIDLVQDYIRYNSKPGQDIYIRLDRSELESKNKRLKAIVAAIASLGLLLPGIACYFLWWKRVKWQGKVMGRMPLRNFKQGRVKTSELFTLTFRQILAATNNFSGGNKLGEGGFGPVYKGILPESQEVAIKRLSKRSSQGLEEFMNELELTAKLQHKNLVRLLGCCVHEEERMLVYEFMPNQSLDKFLFNPSEHTNLDWCKRFQIIEGIAEGLLYLHKHSRMKVIHRDLKASNVLLDGAMNPKISDFGMARKFGEKQTEGNTHRVMGTYGYMSPEYALNGKFSEKSDVFSFGVLLLEIVSGKRSTGFCQDDGPQTLLQWAWELWREERAVELTDPSIRETCCLHEVVKCVHLGLLCVQESALDRPTMASVVRLLGNDTRMLPSPREPGFARIFKNSDSPQRFSGYSKNEVTISSLEAR